MPVFLLIETTSNVCSVAISRNNEIIAQRISREEKAHAAVLAPFIRELLTQTAIAARNLDAIVVSKGPGSYTGLRIGVATAKGLAYAANVPLMAINTLRMMSFGFIAHQNILSPAFLIPMIDARRMEVYSAVFDENISKIRETRADIVDPNSYAEYLNVQRVYFFGSGAAKCKEQINHHNAFFIDGFEPRAEHLLISALTKFKHKEFENIAYFEPFYLKDFLAGIPKKNIFH